MIYPLNRIKITNGYHVGKSLDFGWYGEHNQPILACDDGKVYKIEKQTTGGNCLYIKYNNGIISLFAHLNTINVKKGQKVKLGQKVATMGKTGTAAKAEHLHFGLYSKGKNLHGNADLDPMKYCYVYPEQKVCKTSLYYDKFKYYEEKWTTGKYQLLYDKALRKDHKIALNIWKVKQCSSAVKPLLTSKKPNDDAFLKKKTIVEITKIYKENNRVWGKWGTDNVHQDWIVLCNKDGKEQVKKVG